MRKDSQEFYNNLNTEGLVYNLWASKEKLYRVSVDNKMEKIITIISYVWFVIGYP